MRNRLALTALCLASLAMPLRAQESFGKKVPTVRFTVPEITTVVRGKSTPVVLHFSVPDGFHINSNKPSAEYLIPTALKLNPPTDIAAGRITYPEGQEMSFAFAPNEKLSVYTGDFDLTVSVRPLSTVLPSKYEFHGNLRYQACDNASCYPPKNLPVKFEVKVVKGTSPARKKNPAQSPHVHG